jgi:hypothetical protein
MLHLGQGLVSCAHGLAQGDVVWHIRGCPRTTSSPAPHAAPAAAIKQGAGEDGVDAPWEGDGAAVLAAVVATSVGIYYGTTSGTSSGAASDPLSDPSDVSPRMPSEVRGSPPAVGLRVSPTAASAVVVPAAEAVVPIMVAALEEQELGKEEM